MSLSQDIKFLNLISGRLNRFKWARPNEVAYCRCPFCGDSKKSQTKTRGSFYLNEDRDGFNYKCHNCGICKQLTSFLYDLFPDTYREYKLERLTSRFTDSWEVVKESPQATEPERVVVPTYDPFEIWATPILELDKEHFARAYLENRLLPLDGMKELYYSENFQEILNSCTDRYVEKNLSGTPVVLIPLKDTDGLFGVQCRFLDPNFTTRYLTLKFDESKEKIYGLHKVNSEQDIIVTEGAFDSFFLPNSIAVCGGDFTHVLSKLDKTKLIIVPDNEPRKVDTVRRTKKAIDAGYRVSLLNIDSRHKDINDMVIAGINRNDIVKQIKDNACSGLKAKLKFSSWNKTKIT